MTNEIYRQNKGSTMCYNAKSSLMAFLIITFLSLMLWYRNQKYDRVISAFTLIVGLIQLVESGVHTGININLAGQLIFLILWLQVFIFSVGTYNYLHNIYSKLLVIVFTLALIVAIIYVILGQARFKVALGPSGHIEWYQNSGSLLGHWGWIYLLGIFLPLMLLLARSKWTDLGLYLLLAYGFISLLLTSLFFPRALPSLWCYSAIGIYQTL